MLTRRIYIAAPYDGPTAEDIQAHVGRVELAAVRLIQHGFIPFAPHLSHYIVKKAENIRQSISREYWLEWGLRWLAVCDGILVLDLSLGVKGEIAFAHKHHIPVYFSLEELYRVDLVE